MLRAAFVGALVASLVAGSPARSVEQGPAQRAKATVAAIAALGPRPAGSATERRAGGLVSARLRALGYRVVRQSFPLPRGGSSQNIVGLTSPRPRVVIVAHLDGVSAGPAANDNASGVAVLLEIARALRTRPGVLVAALGAEERPQTRSHLHLGSVRLLAGISRAGRQRIRLALSLDMVGVGPTFNVRGIEAMPNRSARAVLERSRALGLGAWYLPGSQSDHAEMSRAGIPAAWIQWRWDPCWHTACDVASRAEPGKLLAAYRLALASAEAALRGS